MQPPAAIRQVGNKGLLAVLRGMDVYAEGVDGAGESVAQYGNGKCGYELPEELARRESRLKKIAQVKAELEQEARVKAEREHAEAEAKLADRPDEEERTGKKKFGRERRIPNPERAQPEAKAQRTFTDPASRIMPDGANKGSSCRAMTRKQRWTRRRK